MAKKRNGDFQATVLTHLEYMKEKIDHHDDLFEKLFNKFDKQKEGFDKRLDMVEKDVHAAKSIAKIFGGGGAFAAVAAWLMRFIHFK